jgi:RNA polymerase sigma factor (sigma-70 family)
MNAVAENLVPKARSGDAAAVGDLVAAIKDDIYNLCMRMLGGREDAEDATQEILIKVLNGLPGFRSESSFRTWVWRISTNYVLRARRSVREKTCSFEALDHVLKAGAEHAALVAPEITPETRTLANEVRLSCTQAMLLAMDRPHRLAFIIGVVFELDSKQGAEILEISPAAFGKRLERARAKLDGCMQRQCGLVIASAGCSCIRQVTLATEEGHIDAERLMYSRHPVTKSPRSFLGWAEVRDTTTELDSFARALIDHPAYAAPESVSTQVQALIRDRSLSAFR